MGRRVRDNGINIIRPRDYAIVVGDKAVAVKSLLPKVKCVESKANRDEYGTPSSENSL